MSQKCWPLTNIKKIWPPQKVNPPKILSLKMLITNFFDPHKFGPRKKLTFKFDDNLNFLALLHREIVKSSREKEVVWKYREGQKQNTDKNLQKPIKLKNNLDSSVVFLTIQWTYCWSHGQGCWWGGSQSQELPGPGQLDMRSIPPIYLCQPTSKHYIRIYWWAEIKFGFQEGIIVYMEGHLLFLKGNKGINWNWNINE